MSFQYRLASSADLPQLADLRWRLRAGDEPLSDRTAYERFVADFARILGAEWRLGQLVHWIAVDGARVVGVMSVEIVRALPSPENLRDRWGYISSSYVLPEARNAGVGQNLLTVVKDWAREEGLELLVVWPSERAFPLYERAGFERYPDPLVVQAQSRIALCASSPAPSEIPPAPGRGH